MLPCGHSFCFDCLLKVFIPPDAVKCPKCESKHTIGPKENLEKLPKNLDLINMTEAFHSELQEETKSERPPMQIFVRTFEDRNFRFDFKLSDTVESLKAQVEVRTNIPPNAQRLVFTGK